MNNMMAVRCPACNERVEGRSSEDLSRSIKSHFGGAHKMDIEVEMNTSDEGCGSAEETREMSETGLKEKEDLTEFECPMCREDIRGRSEEEMSEAFREHLATTHKDEPFVTRLMEKVGGRR